MNRISVIIPVFNREHTIERCLQSLQKQTFYDLEIIVVDDCSCDQTLSIIHKIALKDPRIKILQNDKNRGPGYSRNRGLSVAQGNYISFLDSDDFLHPKTYEIASEIIQLENHPDLIRFPQKCLLLLPYFSVNISFFSNNIFNPITGIMDPFDQAEYIALETPGVCNKIWNHDFIGDLKFPNTKWEDYPFATPLFVKAQSIFFAPDICYYYCHNLAKKGTTLNDMNNRSNSILEIYDCCDLVEQRCKDFGLFSHFEKAIRGNQKVCSLQRIREVLFSNQYHSQEKKELVTLLTQLTEVKYGPVFTDEYYLKLKQKKTFYRTRMNYVEHLCKNMPSMEASPEEIKKRILEITK